MKEKSESEIVEIVDHRLSLELAHPRKERCKYFGEKIEMDALEYLWIGIRKFHLHLAIDNCTGIVVGFMSKKPLMVITTYYYIRYLLNMGFLTLF